MDEQAILDALLERLHIAMVPYFGESNPSGYVEMYTDDITYFDPWCGGKLAGNAAREHLMGMAGSIPPLDYEIMNPSVDVAGDAAILTLNMQLLDPESGTQVAVWNTTQVHDLAASGWPLVHAHWSYAVPPPEDGAA